jgi:hypothetical protein
VTGGSLERNGHYWFSSKQGVSYCTYSRFGEITAKRAAMGRIGYDAVMSLDISETGLALLIHLQKNSSAMGERISLDPKHIIHRLRISVDQFAQASALLAGHGLAGVRNFRPNANDVPSSKCSAIWLTKKGDDYLKQAEARL